jgi:UDP-N-acetylglucosamine 2-epimerase
MRILIVGEPKPPHALATGLEAAGVEVERPPDSAAAHDDEVRELASALVAFDRLLSDDPPDALLLVSASNLALAAVLVAAKLRIPAAAVVEETREGRTSELNRRLVEQLSDSAVGSDPATITASLRDLIAV